MGIVATRFTKSFHPDYSSGILADLDSFFTSVRNNAIAKNYTTYFDDILINTHADIFHQSKMPTLSCNATNQLATLARVGYPHNTGIVPGVVDSENA